MIAGLLAVTAYTLVVIGQMLDLPEAAAIPIAASFGPFLLIASYGLREALHWRGASMAADLGLAFNALAAALVTAMFLVQIGVGDAFPTDRDAAMTSVVHMVDRVQLSLDMAWDVFASFGAVMFGLAMLGRAPFGPLLGSLGVVVGATLLALNLYAFPRLPIEIGLPDVGPALGGWYLLVSLTLLVALARGKFKAE
jgi:hypothetical protein